MFTAQHFKTHYSVFTDKQANRSEAAQHQGARGKLGQSFSWNSSHRTPHSLLRGWHHDKDGQPVEAGVGNSAAQLTPLLAEGTRVTQVVGCKVAGDL
jgi:hypothetical protein